MSEHIRMNCTGCNNSCPLELEVDQDHVISVDGNCCHRGPISAEKQYKKILRRKGLSHQKQS